MIKIVLFDADNTVINKPQMFSERFAKEFNVPIKKMLPFFKNEFKLCLVGKSDLKIELLKYLDSWGWKKSVDELLHYWFIVEHYIDREMVISIEKLRRKGIRCYFATNQEKYRADYITNKMELKQIFDDLFFSCDLGFTKPSQQFWEVLYKCINNPPKDTVLFWDDDEDCAASAREFGFKAEVYKNFKSYSKIMDGLKL